MLDERYLIDNIQNAVDKGEIEVWFQPHIRSLSGKVSSFEALARWRDSEHGLISPVLFIAPLEKYHLIHILDMHIIEEVCKLYRREVEAGRSVVPVSVNLSLEDFQSTDIVEFIEDCTRHYDIPHSYLKIEITETMVRDDPVFLHEQMERLSRGGFEVWMDDFGSGYSSLNVLKDYHIDVLKIDKGFFTSFSRKSRSIISSVIQMSKEIGIQTLAEGVETDDQFRFLRDAGCEFIQGYYFAKPAPYDQVIQILKKHHLVMETRSEAPFWDKVGEINLKTDAPIAILEDDFLRVKTVFVSKGHDIERTNCGLMPVFTGGDYFSQEESYLGSQIIPFLRALPQEGKEFRHFVSYEGNYLQITACEVTRNSSSRIYLIKLANISMSDSALANSALNGLLRDSMRIFNKISIVNTETRTLEFVWGENNGFVKKRGFLDRYIDDILENQLFPEDINRFRSFLDLETLEKRCLLTDTGFVSDIFRFKNPDGTTTWHEICIMCGKGKNKGYVVAFRHKATINPTVSRKIYEGFTPLMAASDLPAVTWSGTEELTVPDMWRNLISGSTLMFFWKDRNRRFLGASNAFLQYFGINSVSEIIGKTDEDMGWHINSAPYYNDEHAVLNEGKHVISSPGKCIAKGVLRNIMATKLPLYKDGQIAGLIGYFVDSDSTLEKNARDALRIFIDEETGFLNPRGFMATLREYTMSWEENRTDFVLEKFHLHGYSRVLEELGRENTAIVMQEVSHQIRSTAGNKAVISYAGNGDIFMLFQPKTSGELRKFSRRISDSIQSVHRARNLKFTFFVKTKAVRYSDSPDINSIIKTIYDNPAE